MWPLYRCKEYIASHENTEHKEEKIMTMIIDKYVEQAERFLMETNTTCNIIKIGCGKNEAWKDNFIRNFYSVLLENSRGQYTFTFWDSAYNTRKNIKPTCYDILACVTKYDPGIFEDFCSAYGYDSDSISAFKTYVEVQKEYKGISRLFTEEQMEQLREIQ